METKRFRNHYSSVFEKISTFLVTFFLIIILNLGEDFTIEDTGDVVEGLIDSIYLIIGIGIFLLIIGVIIGILSWSWSKTWIVLEENAISVEKNTFTFTKNTLGIKDISNVNLEQNIFEMIIGTSKVKINTNSLSTASTTDIKIILKKKDAEVLKNYLNQKINELNQPEKAVNVENKIATDGVNQKNGEQQVHIAETSAKDIFLNSIYSTNVLASVIIALISCGFLVNIINFIFGADTVDNWLYESLSVTFIIVGIIIFTIAVLIWNCIKNYIKMFNFSVRRENDKIGIKYGMLKQIEFSVPVDKINAIVIHQTLIARLFKKYSAEMVNVGMGDEKEEDTYFCLYGSKEHLVETIKNILPEFADALDVEIEKQPKSAILIKFIGVIMWMVILSAVGAVINHFVDGAFVYVVVVLGIILVISIILNILGFMVAGLGNSDDFCYIKDGAIATKQTIIKFDKIQFMTANKNILTNKLGIVIVRVNILAMQGKNVEILPYLKEEKFKEISEKLLRQF